MVYNDFIAHHAFLVSNINSIEVHNNSH